VPPGTRITSELLTYRSPYVVAHASLASNSANINSSTEVTILTTGSATFTAGRAYRIEYSGLIQHGTASLTDLCYLRFRRTSGSALIRNVQSIPVTNKASVGRNNAVNVWTVVTPVSTVTDSVYMTAAWETGSSATFVLAGTAGTPGLLTVSDVGPASDYPGIATFS
jgi:hypothetical protein